MRFTVNVYNGNIVYWVYTKSRDETTDTLYGTYSGSCAVEIPMMGAQENGSVLGKVTNTVSGIATGVMGAVSVLSGNVVGGAAIMANGISGTAEALQPKYTVDRSGTIDTNSTTQQAYAIRLKISRPNVLRLGEQNILNKGKPSYFICAAQELPKGVNVISDINLDTVNASDAEKTAIREIFKGGVFV